MAKSQDQTQIPTQALRDELVRLLSGEGAHADFEAAVRDFPSELRSAKPAGVPHSAWELLEHLRLAQWDMLEFSRNQKHESPDWPSGYWPSQPAPPDESAWERSVAQFRSDREAMKKLVSDPKSDLFTPFAHGDGQSLLREAMQMADHNAYHVGELIFLRRMLGSWKG